MPSCEAERAAIKNAKKGKEKGKALQALMKCLHRTEFMLEQEQQHQRECNCREK